MCIIVSLNLIVFTSAPNEYDALSDNGFSANNPAVENCSAAVNLYDILLFGSTGNLNISLILNLSCTTNLISLNEYDCSINLISDIETEYHPSGSIPYSLACCIALNDDSRNAAPSNDFQSNAVDLGIGINVATIGKNLVCLNSIASNSLKKLWFEIASYERTSLNLAPQAASPPSLIARYCISSSHNTSMYGLPLSSFSNLSNVAVLFAT